MVKIDEKNLDFSSLLAHMLWPLWWLQTKCSEDF